MGLLSALTLQRETWRLGWKAYQHLPKPFAELPIPFELQTVGKQVLGPVETAHLGGNVDPEVVAPLWRVYMETMAEVRGWVDMLMVGYERMGSYEVLNVSPDLTGN